jgi:metal-responsive CopG/Arc/MetJ family transcriptional regulator
MRTIIDLPRELVKNLDSIAGQDKISRAEAVRRAVAEYVARRSSTRENAAFGIWKSKNIDPLAYEDSLRGEWDR